VDHGGFEYDLHQKEIEGHEGLFSSYSMWGQAVEGSARELLAENESESAGSEVDEAMQFLRDLLADGAIPHKEIQRDYKGAGYSLSTIKRAKKRLGVISKKGSMNEGWFWSLPEGKHEEVHEGDEVAQQNSVNPFGEDEPLRENSLVIGNTWEC
jgi:putative DNA primase/helicase